MRKSVFWTLDYHPELGQSLAEIYRNTQQHAKLADELGYHGLWVAEHHFHNIGSIPNPAVLLSALAKSTKNLRLGPAISVLPFRNASYIAEDYAMVDLISDGRLNMGVGIGNSQEEFDQAGINFEQRRTSFEKRLLELKALWSSPYNISMNSLNVRPKQSPCPPIYISTVTPERAFKAGKSGDSVLTIVPPSASDLSGLKAVIDAHNVGLSESSFDISNAELVTTVYAHSAETESEALTTGSNALNTFIKTGSGNDLPNPSEFCNNAIANNAALIGTSTKIAEQITQYQDIGVKHLSFLANFGGMSSEQITTSLIELAKA